MADPVRLPARRRAAAGCFVAWVDAMLAADGRGQHQSAAGAPVPTRCRTTTVGSTGPSSRPVDRIGVDDRAGSSAADHVLVGSTAGLPPTGRRRGLRPLRRPGRPRRGPDAQRQRPDVFENAVDDGESGAVPGAVLDGLRRRRRRRPTRARCSSSSEAMKMELALKAPFMERSTTWPPPPAPRWRSARPCWRLSP